MQKEKIEPSFCLLGLLLQVYDHRVLSLRAEHTITSTAGQKRTPSHHPSRVAHRH
jgi:hypothetical protein